MSEEMKALREQLLRNDKNGYDTLDEAQLREMEAYCTDYKAFLNAGKTERLSARAAIAAAEERGFVQYKRGMALKAGDKVYTCNRGKGLMLAVIGKESLAEGAAALQSGAETCIGEAGEPQLVITDLLPHLGGEQGRKPLNEAVPGETLNLLVGSRPIGDSEDKDRVKLHVMKRLHDKYGITESDFASAELEAVPAAEAVDIGIDGSMIGSYGHDDRVCGYAALRALLDIETPDKTAVCVLADKEEIGSMGVTGMQSAAFDAFMSDLCDGQNVPLKACFENAFCLSADVTAAYDPNFADVYEKKNAAFVNYGVGICKYTGARGKSGSSDANAETVAYVRAVLDGAGVRWQICELGKIDAGGGGTVAQYMANRNIATLDAGVPVLSMHAPFEVVAKVDCYEMYRACKALYEAR